MLFLTAVLTAAVVLCLAIFFKVESIYVTGNERYDSRDIIEAAGITAEENIFLIEPQAVMRSVSEAFPYIKNVKIIRHLPTDVEIAVTEDEAFYAYLSKIGYYTYLSDEGRVLEHRTGSITEKTVLLMGADLSQTLPGKYPEGEEADALKVAGDVYGALMEAGLDKVNYIDVSDPLYTVLLYDDRIILKVGSRLDLAVKLRTAKEVIDNQLPSDYEGVVDVTVVMKAYTLEKNITEDMNEIYVGLILNQMLSIFDEIKA